MDELRSALTFDAVLVCGVGTIIFTLPQSRLSHPGVIYLLLHAYIVTFRGWAIVAGGATFLGIQPEFVAKAVVMADVFLVCATLGWMSVTSRPSWQSRDWGTVHLRPVIWASVIGIPAGLLSLLATGYIPGAGSGSTVVVTSYQVIAVLWPALALLALIYLKGFRPWLLLPFATYLGVMSLQGYARFRVIVPLLMLLFIYLDSKDRKWPRVPMVAFGLVAFAVFIPLKDIGAAVQEGNTSLGEIVQTVQRSTGQARSGTNSEQAFLDQEGITVRLVDESGLIFYGRPYFAIATLPVPRPLWPGKPGLADHLSDISNSTFPLATVGGITGLPADLYLNFRWFGVVLGGLLFGRLSGGFFRSAYAAPRNSVTRFAYILFAGVLVQVARDGLASLFVFTVVNATPWVLIALFAARTSSRRRRVPRATGGGARSPGKRASERTGL